MDKIFYKKVHRFDRTQTMNEIEYSFRLLEAFLLRLSY